jgi:transposase
MRYKRFFENLPKNQHLPRFFHLKTPFLLQQPKLTTIFALNRIIYNLLILLILELIFSQFMAPQLEPRKVEAIRNAIRTARAAKPNLKAIAKAFHTTYSTVLRHRNSILLEMGAAERRNIRAQPGRKLAVNDEVMYFVLQLLDQDNDLYQDEVANEIYDVFDIKLSQSQMSRMYKKMRLSQKKVDYVASQQDKQLIQAWRDKSIR